MAASGCIEAGQPPRQIETPDGCRYADFEFDLPRRRVLAVREDHRGRPPTDPKAAIVALPLDPGGTETILVEGPDFLSSPRLSPDGETAVLDRLGSSRHALGRHQAFRRRRDAGRQRSKPRSSRPAKPRKRSCSREWHADGALYFCSDRTGWWNLYVLRGGKIEPLAPVEAEIGGPHWVFRQRYYDFLGDGRIIAAIVRNGIRTAVLIADGQDHAARHRAGAGLPAPLRRWPRLYRNAAPTAPPSVCRCPELNGGTPSVIRSAAPAVVPQDTISLGEPIEFATPGGIAHAFWYPPKNRDYQGPAGELPPLVVLSHGGPTSMTTNSFSLSVQWWTSRGFGVVDVNYGGSTGFGRAYRERLDGQWGVVDVADCAAAASLSCGTRARRCAPASSFAAAAPAALRRWPR